jgi:hypothetical protein
MCQSGLAMVGISKWVNDLGDDLIRDGGAQR